MQDSPLLISGIIRHGESVYSEKKVFTVTHEGVEEATFFQVSSAPSSWPPRSQARVQPGDRVGTFMWNNQAHMEAYIAVPCMGACCTPQHPALPEQLRLSSTTPGTR